MTEQTKDIQQARLAVLYEASARLGTSLDLTEVLNQVMDSIIHLTGAERGFLMLFDEDTGQLKTMAARNVDQKTIDSHSMQISRTVIEKAVATGKGILTNNAQEDERFASQQSVVGYQLRSIMCAPLMARGRTLGAVYVDNRLFTGVFQEADLEMLETFANQAAIAIENARLFTRTDQELARRVEELSIFQQIDQQLNKSLDLQRVLNLALSWAVKLTRADGGSIGLLEETEDGNKELRLLVVEGNDEHTETRRVLTTDHPVLARILEQGESILLHKVSPEEAIDGSPATEQLCVPIRYDGEITGLLTLETYQEKRIRKEDISFVERVADRAAVAIKNARLYEAIQAANKAKSDFISIVTHELRLPMTSIKGYTDLLLSGMTGPLTDQQKEFLEVVRRNLVRMGDLIRDLSDINRIESGRMKFENSVFDLQDVVEDVVMTLRERIESRQQSLHLEIPESLPKLYADPKRVGQVLSNLVSNAHKYTPDGGSITIRAWANGEYMHVAVADTGIGISEENQAKLFTQFFRAEDRAVREQAGWGLGLSIVKKIVEAQGGEISFTSKLGEGSTFTFTVPLAKLESEGQQE
ncbi:MAG: GAF domain-containing protein [Chloroflexi bacterium]|nr:MAG: GAF domain-containing protein [Chloroflexota bacterium]